MERHGWSYASEFIDELPTLKELGVTDMEWHGAHIRVETARNYLFRFRLKDIHSADDMSFPMLFLGALLTKQDMDAETFHCEVNKSEDGENHFTLLQEKQKVTISVS